jgi:hypothetical protein
MKGGEIDQSNYFKGEKFVKGYGFKGCGIRDQYRKFKNWITPLWQNHVSTKIQQGLLFLRKEAANNVSNVANDVLNGKDVRDSIASNINTSIANVKEAIESSLKGGGAIKVKKKRNSKPYIFLKKMHRPDIYS